jgi:hypothetical protein
MKINIKLHYTSLTLSILALCLVSIPAVSQENAVKLVYNYPAGTPVSYQTSSKVIQDMDVNGQSMVVNVLSVLGCTVKSTGNADNNLVLEVTIDTLSQTIDTPGGMTGGTIRDAMGKSFSMKISPEGKETDMSGAEQISYKTDEGTTTTAAQSFNDFFPDLPDRAINPGYTWSSTDTLTAKTSAMTMIMVIKSDNKFEGYEELNGTKCAKITYTLSGSRNMKTQTQGMDIIVKGPLTGTGELYFSPEKGYFMKLDVKTRMTGQLEITSPESMSFPVIMDMNSTTEVK